MRRILASPLVAGLSALLFSVCLLVFLYLFVWPFSEYFHVVGRLIKEYRELFLLITSLTPVLKPTLIAGMAVFLALHIVSTLEGAPRLSRHPLHRADYYFTLLVAALCFFLIAPLFLYFRYAWLAHLVFPVLALVLSLHVLTTTLVRIRAHSLSETVLWVRVFRTLPLNTPSGVLIAISVSVLTGFIIYRGVLLLVESFSNVFVTDSRFGDALGSFFALFLIPAFIVAVIALLCRDVVALTAEQRREADRRIKAERLKTELITNVTHDLRTPLTTIINYIDHIKSLNIEDETLHDYLEVLDKKSQRLKHLINDLLDASKAGSGNISIQSAALDLHELVGQIAGDFEEALEAASIEYVGPREPVAVAGAVGVKAFEYVGPHEHTSAEVWVRADGEQLRRVLENLFSNAAKYSLPATRLYVDIVEPVATLGGGGARIGGGNSGGGATLGGGAGRAHGGGGANGGGGTAPFVELRIRNISKKQLAVDTTDLTQQFVRGDSSRSEEGSGLGLYIAERLMALMDGNLTISTTGDLFETILRLPRETS